MKLHKNQIIRPCSARYRMTHVYKWTYYRNVNFPSSGDGPGFEIIIVATYTDFWRNIMAIRNYEIE